MKPRLKHNKKRNTAILYETLIRELTKAIVRKNSESKEKIVSMIKEHFNKSSVLSKELTLYKALCETYDMKPSTAEKLIYEIREKYKELDQKEIFQEQSGLIKKMNKLSKSVFSNFVPNYKSLATVYHIFNPETSTKDRVLLEESVFSHLVKKVKEKAENMKSVDNLTYKTFVSKFNEEYADLLNEQRGLLAKYISSFVDNGVELKIYLNEEIARLKEVVSKSLNMKEIKEDETMTTKTNEILNMIENFKNHPVSRELVGKVLKIQNLVQEIQN